MSWSIGEVACRIIGKAIARILAHEIQEATGPLRTCAGHLSGCEAAVHVVHEVFEDGDADCAILVDATNAFNCLNRQTALMNIMNLCPALSKVLINTYRQYIPLFIEGESILSKERKEIPCQWQMYMLLPLHH